MQRVTIYTVKCNIWVVKIPKIKICNPSLFRKTCFVMSLKQTSDVN